MNRREFLQSASAAAAGWAASRIRQAPAIVTSERMRPAMPCGVQSGDVTASRAIVWSRADRPARMVVEYATTESFQNPRRVVGPAAIETTDFTARLDLRDLTAGQRYVYRVTFEDLSESKITSEPVTGTFKTPPAARSDVSLVWGGDICGQGWGINPEFGGMKIYDAMQRVEPDFFIHSGDAIYADGPIVAEVKLADGSIWKNLTTPAKAKVAETLEEFRGNYLYNFLDEPFRRFNATVPMLAQWDDHEVRNNWYPGQILDDKTYTVKSVDLLSARARRAFQEYSPLRFEPDDPERIYRAFNYGPLLDVVMLDERSYRGRNSQNRQPALDADSALLGSAQLNWIKQRLASSRAMWKVIASDMPVGVLVRDGKNFEAFANGDGPALGRELEIADLLRFIKQRNIRNVVWVTADIHYCAAHYYSPAKAQFTDFRPFWEFVAGPFNAGTFGPTPMDNTFGPEVKFVGIPKGMPGNRSPRDGFQFFGHVRISGKTGAMTVSLHDLNGKSLYSVELAPER